MANYYVVIFYLFGSVLFFVCSLFWTLDKPMASLSTCHLELVVWVGNLVKSIFAKLYILVVILICGVTQLSHLPETNYYSLPT